MIGERFGRMHVLAVVRGALECRCDCGVTKRVRASDLRRGTTKSCGCLRAERARARTFRHGAATRSHRSPEWVVWRSMRQRCTDRHHKNWPDYGGRGITFDPAWNSFEKFLSDMGPRPFGLQLERKENDQGYSKANCVWATRSAQALNRRPAKRSANGTFAPKESHAGA